MSVIVKGMEMPKGSCEWIGENGSLRRCKLLNGDDDCKMQEGVCADATWEEQFAGCPLIEIPTPHSDLVDRDALIAEYDRQHKGPVGGARQIMVDAKAVIKADGYQRQWVDWHTKGREE